MGRPGRPLGLAHGRGSPGCGAAWRADRTRAPVLLRVRGTMGAMSSTQQALIVGGGIGGLAAALAALRAGWEVRLFERAASISEAPCRRGPRPGC